MSNLTMLNEPHFCPRTLNKYATLMAAGNGYLGLRACHEEAYTDQTRGMYLAGFYHRASAAETTELVNLPDILHMRIELDGQIFTLLSGSVVNYQRELNFANGELTRRFEWLAPNGKRYRIVCQRFASAARLSLVCSRIAITPVDENARVTISTGIDATQTNSGRQHLDETSVRVHEQRYLQGRYTTLDGSNELTISSYCDVAGGVNSSFFAKNRRLTQHCEGNIRQGETFELVKTSWIASSLDEHYQAETAGAHCLEELTACISMGYQQLLAESAQRWADYWQKSRVIVDSDNGQDLRALDFALYHLFAMTPTHSERCSIAAKGLTGEGYKGHIFWDTEVFLLPFTLLTRPEVARQLLSYRWHNLAGAREKALANGYRGALYPWESAWSGQEETPEFAAINIRTGFRQKVASALAEHHLVADIAWATECYREATGDEAFMGERGVALLTETAKFWLSRAVEANGRLEIHNVIGPDEYTEHVNNNAYTNYMAYHNVALAVACLQRHGIEAREFVSQAKDLLKRLWLPEANEAQLIEQDDNFFTKPTIDLAKYKAQQGSQAILLDYSRAEVNDMQVLKQADVVMLTYMLPWLFTPEQLAANMDYYEPRTIHDSSLSKAIHGVIAARCGRTEQAYQFWQQACLIDLGDNPHSCDDGIHAAATGAIWLGAVQGFAGLTIERGELCLAPRLPESWRSLSLPFCWQGHSLRLSLNHQQLTISAPADVTITMRIAGRQVSFNGSENFALSEFMTPVSGSGTITEGTS